MNKVQSCPIAHKIKSVLVVISGSFFYSGRGPWVQKLKRPLDLCHKLLQRPNTRNWKSLIKKKGSCNNLASRRFLKFLLYSNYNHGPGILLINSNTDELIRFFTHHSKSCALQIQGSADRILVSFPIMQ